jgi:hypothetical protein
MPVFEIITNVVERYSERYIVEAPTEAEAIDKVYGGLAEASYRFGERIDVDVDVATEIGD